MEHRAARVAMVTGLSTIVNIVLQIIAVPILLEYWGKEIYGIWLAIYAAFLLLKSPHEGFVNYVGNKLNLLYHQNKIALRETLASAIVGIVILGGFSEAPQE